MYTNFVTRLAVAAAAFSLVTATAALAEDDCKSAVTAAGQPASLRDLGAYPNSLLAWRSAVKDKYGSEYNSWRYAKDRDVKCDQKDGKWTCVRNAKPCKDVLHKLIDGAKQEIKKDCKAESLNSYGAAKKNEKDAQDEAVSGWKIDVAKKYGKDWAEWDRASGTDIDCHKVGNGVQCIADATPCK
jgi:hypothetical protein